MDFSLKEKTLFIINCKNYEEIAGSKITKFVKIAEKIAKKHKMKIAVAPPQHLLGQISNSKILILAQHLDNAKIGSTTGFMIPELVKKSMIGGSLINHSEHRISSKEISALVSKLKELKMISVICVKNVAEAKKYAKLNPDYIAIEPPELIGSGHAISKERPDIIERYDRFDTLTEPEIEALANYIYGITQGHFKAWGLSRAMDTRTVPYFNGSHIDTLLLTFPKLSLNRLRTESALS